MGRFFRSDGHRQPPVSSLAKSPGCCARFKNNQRISKRCDANSPRSKGGRRARPEPEQLPLNGTLVSPRRARSSPLSVSLDISPGGIGNTPRMSQSVWKRTIATKEMLRRSRHRSLSQRRPLWCPRLATGFESRWQLRSGGTRCEAVSELTQSSEVPMAGAPARH